MVLSLRGGNFWPDVKIGLRLVGLLRLSLLLYAGFSHADSWHVERSAENAKQFTTGIGPSVNKEYLSQIQFYSIFSKLPVISNTV